MGPSCHGLQELNPKLDAYLAQGLDRDAVRAAFVREYGDQTILAAPIDRGFNRLAWILPYVIGATGALGAFVLARRWSKRSAAEPSAAVVEASENADLRARLDDELRDLD